MSSSSEIRYILLTDIGGSTHLWEAFPEHYPAALGHHNRIIEEAVADCGGAVMKNLGDGYVALFDSAADGLRSALQAQLAMAQVPAFPDGERIAIRAVVHGGPLQQLSAGRGLFGTPFNRAERIAAVCHPGQTLVSTFAHAGLGTDLPPGCELSDMGRVRLRDLSGAEELWQLVHPGLRQQFPPLRSLDSRPNNLAAQPNAFVGREAELRELRRLLQDRSERLVTLTAPGGYGKTRLARQLCASVLHRYEHGVFVVELAALDTRERLPEAIGSATGFQFSGSREPRLQVLDYLRGKDMLLCFDNFEHVLDGVGLVAELLNTAPHIHVLATSREPLRLAGERVYKLPPLPTGPGSDSVQLFADRAAQVEHGFSLDAQSEPWVERICDRLEGVPLSIELFAAWTDSFSLEQMHGEVDRQLEQTARMRDVPERQRSVRASCDWSWGLLNEQQREGLQRLAPFKGGFFPDAAQAVLAAPLDGAAVLLDGLADKSWLYMQEVEWTILDETIVQTRYFIRDAASHEYVWERLREARADGSAVDGTVALQPQALAAHAAYFAALLDRDAPLLKGAGVPDRGQVQLAAFKRLTIEQANLLAALDTALAQQALQELLRLAARLWWLLDRLSEYRQEQASYTLLLAAAQRLGSPALELEARLGLAAATWRLGDYAEATQLAQAARALAIALGDAWGEAAAVLTLALVERLQSNYPAARESFTRLLAMRRALGDRSGEASALGGLGIVEGETSNYDGARAFYAEALAIWRSLGDRNGEGQVLNNLGYVEAKLSNYDAARELHTQSLAIRRSLSDPSGEAFSLNNLGIIEFEHGDRGRARDLFTQALAIQRILGERSAEARSLHNLGHVALEDGDCTAARALLDQALALRRELGDRFGEAASLTGLGNIEFVEGDFAAARELHTASLALRRSLGEKYGESNSLNYLGNVECLQGHLDAARALYVEALTIRLQLGAKRPLALSCATSAALLAQLGRFQPAAVGLYGTLAHCAALGYEFEPADRPVVDLGLARLEAALAAGEVGADELAQWRAAGEALSLDELAALPLRELGEA